MALPEITIYADGACSGNPGPGGYGAIIREKDRERELSGYEKHTTNNRMELMAVIKSLETLKSPAKITVITDSNYVVKGMKEWIHNWLKNGWMNSQRKAVSNRDLWEQILKLSAPHRVQWKWVKGHNGHIENERCDQLALEAINNKKEVFK